LAAVPPHQSGDDFGSRNWLTPTASSIQDAVARVGRGSVKERKRSASPLMGARTTLMPTTSFGTGSA